MTSECCEELDALLEKNDGNEVVSAEDNFLFANIINNNTRQCTCLLRNPGLILPMENFLKQFYTFSVSFAKKLAFESSDEVINSIELLFQAICKSLQVTFPLYQAYESVKNNFEVTEEQKEAIHNYCDVSDSHVSELLFQNVAHFCDLGGIGVITMCFSKPEQQLLPLRVASCLIGVVAQFRTLLHEEATNRLIRPLSASVTKYLCNTPEEELRLISARSTAEMMINTLKVQDSNSISNNIDVLNISFKYFMSTTLAVRMAGLNLITNQIHNLIELGQKQMFRETIDGLCTQMAVWLNENEMVEHLFGPNYHIELIKQSQFLLNFLAQERQLHSKHLDCLWTAAQLKHISRYVLELLIMLAKVMDLVSVQYLLQQIAKLPVYVHTKQTLLLASLLTRGIWSAGLTGASPDKGSPEKISPKKLTFPSTKCSPFKQLHVSPIQSPSLSSDASSDEEMADIHSRRYTDQLKDLDMKISGRHIRTQFIAPLLQLSPSAMEDIETCLLGNDSESIIEKAEDAISCTNTNGSSTDRERDLIDDLDEDASMSSRNDTPLKMNDSFPIEFEVESLCEPGNTLLWDLIQNTNAKNMPEGLLEEAQKLLWQLICYAGNKKVRMVFIKGCLDNIKNNQAVMVSFKILPKIISVFPHSTKSSEANMLLMWAVKELQLMDSFFNNLQHFAKTIESTQEESLIEEAIQSRLDFLTAMYSNDITPDHFRLSIAQVDSLWSCLVTQMPDNFHYLILSWLLKQTNSEELHALGLDSFKHIFVQKLSELNADKMTLTGLSLFQKLFGLTRLSNASPFAEQEAETEEYLLGTQQLWNIALKAERLHVSNEAMNILNHLYLTVGESSVRKESEFMKKCMNVLKGAVQEIEMNLHQALKMIQQVLKILKNHLQDYSKRLAYHLELWNLTGKNINSHQNLHKTSSKDVTLRVICQPTGVADKISFKLLSSQLLATLRARITHWCVGVQKRKPPNDTSTELKPPFRLISHGHELTQDLDMKTVGEIGMRDQQLVYVSVMNTRKDRLSNPSQLPPSLQPPPNFDSVPMIQLLKEENFTQLFNLLSVLYKVSKKSLYQEKWLVGKKQDETLEQQHDDPHELVRSISAEALLNNTWELILMLPTNPLMREKYLKLEFDFTVSWSSEINFEKKFTLLYVLQILDALSLPLVKQLTGETNADSSSDSDSSLTDVDYNPVIVPHVWINKLFDIGLVEHLLSLLLSRDFNIDQDEWILNCLAYIVKLLTRIGLVNLDDTTENPGAVGKKHVIKKSHVFRARYRSTEADNVVVIQQLSERLLNLLHNDLFQRLICLLCHISQGLTESFPLSNQDVRASVVYHCLSFLVCWVSSNKDLGRTFIDHKMFSSLLIQLVFYCPQRSVRSEGSRGIYKLCVCGSQLGLNKVLSTLMGKLKELVHLQQVMKMQTVKREKSLLSNYKDFFWLLCRLINKYVNIPGYTETNIRASILEISSFIQDFAPVSAENHSNVDYCLIGLLQSCTALLHHDKEFKSLPDGFKLMQSVFNKSLFNLPTSSSCESVRPQCETKPARLAAFELLLQLVSGCKEAFLEVLCMFLKHHVPNKKTNNHCVYGWNYWPYEQERSSTGYLGLINLGATCYMASCVQQLFMIPKARYAILQAPVTEETKHPAILKEVQKMFSYLHGSIRKAYNPKCFCRTYTMDKQPLNTGDQKDMTEFFTDFVSKLEEMGPDLKMEMRELFCGVITNNVISLDCSHVSKTEEEFYSVRCTVADMKNLYESLDEVTVKDVLEGDNKYTCSQCNAKVRAEKRACFRSLPKIMCFNTMRYTFNMVTMMKEKVNTHFSFPMKLNMAAYTEEFLLTNNGEGDPDEQSEHWYNLAGVVVHTGTADGGHYYSFIRDRTTTENNWYLFNDAEVKTFDPMQIAAECFGGEMTTKTFDAMTEKYMDFSIEKTHSAYMLFYEHSAMDKEPRETGNISLPNNLQKSICEDNYQFLQDKLVFESNYFNFLWLFCNDIPQSLSEDVIFHVTKLAASFLFETLVHSREKPNMKAWVELLIHGFDTSQRSCEWFLGTMNQDDWWLQQMFIKCPAQHLRQMFGQLCLIAIRNLRTSQLAFYTTVKETGPTNDNDNGDLAGSHFIKSLLALLEENLRSYCKNLGELFHFLHQFLSLGHEECAFLLEIDAISTIVQFYNSLKSNEVVEASCEDDEELEVEDEEILVMFPEDKFYPSALEKMVGSIALLLEAARDGPELHLSDSDMQCFISTKDFPFIYQITLDGINLRQTANIIFHLSCYNHQMAEMIVHLLITAAQKLPMEQSQNFFKLLSLLTDVGENGLPGLPSFTSIILPKIWQTTEMAPALTLDWLSNHVPRNKQIHKFVLESMEQWVERYLIADASPRIRGGAAYLLVSLVPNNHFPQAFRGRVSAVPHKPVKMSDEAQVILHKVYKHLLDMLKYLRKYCDKSHAGTTRLINYFTVLNYCCISDKEKIIFTPYSMDLWQAYHPAMSEPDVSVHFNKQALLMFWYQACDGCEDNIKFITETKDVASNVAYNYILSNDDQEVVSYNNATLPMYYGILRLACNFSNTFCKTLSSHPNMTWAFEHLLPRANHYPQVVEELLQLIKLFCGANYTSEEDLKLAMKFRRKAIELACNYIEGHHTWTTLINLLRMLIESEEDCIHVVCNNGLNPLAEAFSTLHIMYHEATACNVTNDIIEVSTLLHTILGCTHSLSSKFEGSYKALHGWIDRTDIMLKALSLLNSFVSKEIQKICLDLLTILLQIYPEECIETIAHIIHQSHLAVRMMQGTAQVGPHFPRCDGSDTKGRKISPSRTEGPELNMTLHPQLLGVCTESLDRTYEGQLCEYFEGYHLFVDKMCRYGLNLDPVPLFIIEISCLLAVEVLPLKFLFFPKLWQEVWNKSIDNPKYRNCIQRLFLCDSFIEFMDTLFTDERILFDNPIYYSFACVFLPKVHNKILFQQQKNSVIHAIVTNIVSDVTSFSSLNKDEFEHAAPKLHGDIRSLCLLLSVLLPRDLNISTLLEDCLNAILSRLDQEKSEEIESPINSETTLEPPLKKKKLLLEAGPSREESSSSSCSSPSYSDEDNQDNMEKEDDTPEEKVPSRNETLEEKTATIVEDATSSSNDATSSKTVAKTSNDESEDVVPSNRHDVVVPQETLESVTEKEDKNSDVENNGDDKEAGEEEKKVSNSIDHLRKACVTLLGLLSRLRAKGDS